jgi:hypothetical protein
MHFLCWLDIKANEYFSETKKGEAGYDPTQKYWLVWDAMTHNMIMIIKRGGKDATMDETTWPNFSWADKRYAQPSQPGEKRDKGGQHVLLLDSK